MNTKKREFIDPNELMRYINENHCYSGLPMAAHICTMELLTYAPRVDAVEVVRCEKCVHCVNDEEEPGMCKCVESAEYESESGLWLGFVEYHTPDFFCAFGERKDND